MASEINGNSEAALPENSEVPEETPHERAMRAFDRLRGSMKDEIAAFGGTEAFINWVRGRDEDSAVDIWLRSKERKS